MFSLQFSTRTSTAPRHYNSSINMRTPLKVIASSPPLRVQPAPNPPSVYNNKGMMTIGAIMHGNFSDCGCGK